MINLRCSYHQKQANKRLICVLRLLEALFFVKENNSLVITDVGHCNMDLTLITFISDELEVLYLMRIRLKSIKKSQICHLRPCFQSIGQLIFIDINEIGVKLILLLYFFYFSSVFL